MCELGLFSCQTIVCLSRNFSGMIYMFSATFCINLSRRKILIFCTISLNGSCHLYLNHRPRDRELSNDRMAAYDKLTIYVITREMSNCWHYLAQKKDASSSQGNCPFWIFNFVLTLQLLMGKMGRFIHLLLLSQRCWFSEMLLCV